jgi:hypothetical protein
MFRVTVTDDQAATLLDVEGRLAGPWVGELKACWEREKGRGRPIRVRFAGATFIDASGRALLEEMSASGAELEGGGCLIRAILAAIAGKFCSKGANEAAAPTALEVQAPTHKKESGFE